MAQGAFDVAAHAPANDEVAHIPAGYDALAHRRFSLNPEHPPLVKEWAALPLLALAPRWPDVVPRTARLPEWEAGRAFLYHAGNDPIALTAWPRAMCLLLGIGVCALIFAWGARALGATAALAALGFAAFDPNLLAASTIVYTDLGAALGTLLVLLAARACLAGVTRGRSLALGAAMGAAAAMKFSTLVLAPLALAVLVAGARPRRLARVSAAAGLALLAAGLVVWATYGFTVGPALSPASPHRALAVVAPEAGRNVVARLERVPLPAPDFWRGIGTVALHNREGHRAYLGGRFSQTGFPLYFPTALAVKTPLPTLVLFALGLASLVWRRPRAEEALLAAAVVLVLGTAVAGRIDIGYRHVLPAVPPLLLLGARALAPPDRRGVPRALPVVIVALLAWLAADAGSVGPHHHAFFNALAGGPSGGHRVLLDSNIDLGQDLPALARFQRRHGLGEVALAYFGEAEPAAYGVHARPLTREEMYAPHPGTFVVSVNELYNLTTPDDPERFDWLRARRPDAVLGYTLYVFVVPAAADGPRGRGGRSA